MESANLSKTAANIAIKFYGLTLEEPYRSLFEDEIVQFYTRIVHDMPAPLAGFASALQKGAVRHSVFAVNEKLLPGDLMHVLMRKYAIGQWVEKLVENGFQQLLVLGAGFDHLVAHWSARGILSAELDTPGMMEFKTEFLNKSGYNNQHLNLVAADLARNSLSFLLDSQTNFDSSRKTIVVAEGFFDYLTPHQSRNILHHLGKYFSSDLVLLSTVFALDELSPIRSAIYKTGVGIAGEKLRLLYSLDQYKSLLKDHRFTIDEHHSGYDMQLRHLKPRGILLPVLRGFHLLKTMYG